MPKLFRDFETFGEIEEYIKSLETKLDSSIDVALSYGQTDGAHHKMWVIDQIVRILCADEYNQVIKEYCKCDNDEYEYEWDVGIAP